MNDLIEMVTDEVQQVSRVDDDTALMYLGQVVEQGPTARLFMNSHLKRTGAYITGRFG